MEERDHTRILSGHAFIPRLWKQGSSLLIFFLILVFFVESGFTKAELTPEVIDLRTKKALPSLVKVMITDPAIDPDVSPLFSKNGEWLLTQMKNGSGSIWSTTSGRLQAIVKPKAGMVQKQWKISPADDVLFSVIEPQNPKRAMQASSGIQIWNMPQGSPIAFIQKDHVQQLEFSADGKYMMMQVAGIKNQFPTCQIELWSIEDVVRPKYLYSFEELYDSCYKIKVGIEPKNQVVWVHQLRLSIMHVYDLHTKDYLYYLKHILESKIASEAIPGTAFVDAAQKPGHLLVGFNPLHSEKEATLYEIDARTGKEIATLWPSIYGHFETMLVAAYPRTAILLTQKAWRKETQPVSYFQKGGTTFALWQVLHNYVFGVRSGFFSPDGQKVLLNVDDRELWVYRAVDGNAFYLEQTGVHGAARFSMDSHTIQTAGIVPCEPSKVNQKKSRGFCLAIQTWMID